MVFCTEIFIALIVVCHVLLSIKGQTVDPDYTTDAETIVSTGTMCLNVSTYLNPIRSGKTCFFSILIASKPIGMPGPSASEICEKHVPNIRNCLLNAVNDPGGNACTVEDFNQTFIDNMDLVKSAFGPSLDISHCFADTTEKETTTQKNVATVVLRITAILFFRTQPNREGIMTKDLTTPGHTESALTKATSTGNQSSSNTILIYGLITGFGVIVLAAIISAASCIVIRKQFKNRGLKGAADNQNIKSRSKSKHMNVVENTLDVEIRSLEKEKAQLEKEAKKRQLERDIINLKLSKFEQYHDYADVYEVPMEAVTNNQYETIH